jgi:hypothetical protein
VFLQQDNELAEMRQSLQQHTDHLGDLKMHTKKSSEDVEEQRSQLCISIRALSVASKTLGRARGNLEVSDSYIAFPFGFRSSNKILSVPTPKHCCSKCLP